MIDQEIINLAKAHDEQALELILFELDSVITYMSNKNKILGMDKEDIAQELRIKVLSLIDTYDALKGEFKPFITNSLSKYIKNIYKSQNRDKRKMVNICDEQKSLRRVDKDDKDKEEEYLLATYKKDSIAEMIMLDSYKDMLTEFEYAVLELRYEKYKVEEICEILDKTTSQVAKALGRIRVKIVGC